MRTITDAKAAFTSWYGPHETWYELPTYDNTWFFLLRMMTHPCAPGFTMLMGVRSWVMSNVCIKSLHIVLTSF